jgi:hypothetical protein
MTGMTKDQIRDRARRMVDNLHKPDPLPDAFADQILASLLGPNSLALNYFENAMPGFRAAYDCISRLPNLSKIAENAVARDRREFTPSPSDVGPWAIATSRPGERWTISDQASFCEVLRAVSQDIWCDLDMVGNGWCVSDMRFAARHNDLSAYADMNGKMFNRSLSLPLAHGDLIVVSRICLDCWIKFVKRYKIQGVRVQNPDDTVH